MRVVRRSLSPGRVFIERNGIVSKVCPEDFRNNNNSMGWQRVDSGGVRLLVQWGISGSHFSTSTIHFPVAFSREPTVTLQAQSGRAVIEEVTLTGFSITTELDTVLWEAHAID